MAVTFDLQFWDTKAKDPDPKTATPTFPDEFPSISVPPRQPQPVKDTVEAGKLFREIQAHKQMYMEIPSDGKSATLVHRLMVVSSKHTKLMMVVRALATDAQGFTHNPSTLHMECSVSNFIPTDQAYIAKVDIQSISEYDFDKDFGKPKDKAK